MNALAVILARAGSKGVPGKNRAIVGGRVCVSWTIDFAKQSAGVERVVLTSDDTDLLQVAMSSGIDVVLRPLTLASDTASVEDTVRHAVESVGWRDAPVAVLYGNVPVRPADLLDRALRVMEETGADSVQSYSPVGKHHPWWTVRVGEDGAATPWEGDVINHGVDRRQDLPAAHIPDGGVLVVSCDALFHRIDGAPKGPHRFLGADRRAVVSPEGSVIDIDEPIDLIVADATLRALVDGTDHSATPWSIVR